jgi:hypothetical protein
MDERPSMQKRAILLTVAVMLTSGLAAIGCQFIAGIADLSVTDGASACTMASECGPDTDCRTFVCANGTCKADDMKIGMSCGDPTDDTCTDPDTCDGAGTCKSNHAEVGTPCGGTCDADLYTPPGICNNTGKCSTQVQAASCSPFACNQTGTACTTSCNMSGGCSKDSVCFMKPMKCESCGFTPPPMLCSGCESCSGNTCVKVCDSPDECTTSLGLDAIAYPVRLECNDQCNNITVTCQGGAPCEVVCDSGGCQNLTLLCGLDGPCKLTCNGSGCMGGAIVSCGGNTCTAACSSEIPIQQVCNQSCSCKKEGCL